uniref:NAD-dependent epimerase/dehydratase domain-containing protein n=1 Tax=Oryza rufipogon TaxID=4529 RepID=A0A0E0QQ51_ORYRU
MDREALRMVCSREFWRMAVLWTVSLLYSYILLFFLRRGAPVPRLRPMPEPDDDAARRRRRRPVCVITGATSGLGKAAAAALAREGYHTVQQIRDQQPDAHLEAFQIDLSSYKSIKKFETSLNQWIKDSNMEHSIQLLVNNAGILAKSYRITEDGLDEMIQANYIGPFVLTNILLPLLKNSSTPSRVVNLTSFTHRCVSEINLSEKGLSGVRFGHWPARRSYLLASTYEYTKFCLLMFSYELHRQLHLSSGVSVMAADPGVVQTGIMRELPPCLSWLALSVLRLLNLLQQPDTGVDAVLDAALAPPDSSGKYFFGGKGRTITSSQLSYNVEVAKKLWAESLALFNELQNRPDVK